MKRVWEVNWREKHEQGNYKASQLVWCEYPEDAINLVQNDGDCCPVKGTKWTAREFTEADWDASFGANRKHALELGCIWKHDPEEFNGIGICEAEECDAIRELWKEQRDFAAHPKLLEV